MQVDDNNIRRVTFAQTVPQCPPSDSGEALAIQLTGPKRDDFLTPIEQDEILSIRPQPDEQELLEEEALWFDPIDDGETNEPIGHAPRSEGPFLPCRKPDTTDTSPRLATAVPASSVPTWTISAPEIERAIRTLIIRLKRTPTDAEIAKGLNLSVVHYHEALMLLKDLKSAIAMRDFSPKESARGSDMIWVGGGLDSASFWCLRWEILKLFRNAVRMLPERERLVMALSHCDNLSDMEILVALDISESTLTRLSASAYLHLRARLFGSYQTDHYSSDIRPADAGCSCSDTQSGPEANIYVSASQSGWLPTGQAPKVPENDLEWVKLNFGEAMSIGEVEGAAIVETYLRGTTPRGPMPQTTQKTKTQKT
jgi:hypothetical protein